MSATDEGQLGALAAYRHLSGHGYSPYTVPDFYLQALKNHIAIFKNDVNFRVHFQPGQGCMSHTRLCLLQKFLTSKFNHIDGMLTCLEKRCNKYIPLDARPTGDGGKAEGFGRFTEYQKHCRSDENHKVSRLERLKGEEGQKEVTGRPPVPTTARPTAASPAARTAPRSLLTALNNFGGAAPTSTIQTSPTATNAYTPALARPAPFASTDAAAGASDATPQAQAQPPTPATVGSGGGTGTRKRLSDEALRDDVVAGKSTAASSQEASTTTTASSANASAPIADGSAQKKLKVAPTGFGGGPSSGVDSPGVSAAAVATGPTAPAAKAVDAVPRISSSTAAYPGIPPVSQPYQYNPYAQLSGAMPTFPGYAGVPNGYPAATGYYGMGSTAAGPSRDPLMDIIDRTSQLGASASAPLNTPWYENMKNGDSDDDEDMKPFVSRLANMGSALRANLNDFLTGLTGSSFDENVTVDKAIKDLGLKDAQTLLPGMASLLLPHQLLGVNWMLQREEHKDRGGILADEMGLGKTIQTIAMMTQNMSDDPAVKTTLIVAPLALLTQWKEEIARHTDANQFKVLIYHGASRKKHTQKRHLQKYDIILTTYHTMAMEHPNPNETLTRRKKKKDDFVESDSEYDSDEDTPSRRKKITKPGLLITFPWYRVVLDEAQNIRNKRTNTSYAAAELDSIYRWCLTGTPITNTLEDVYSMFRYLGVRPWNDWTDFRLHISSLEKNNPEIATTRLQAIFNTVLLRRKKNTKLDGQLLIRLPEKTVADDTLFFSTEEQCVYDFVAARAKIVFNRFLRAGTVLKNYHHVFTMLLRLRQICVHPCLIHEENGFMDVFRTPDELEAVKGQEDLNKVITRALKEQGAMFVDRLRDKLKEQEELRMKAEKEGTDASLELECCVVCLEPFDDKALVTACGHVLCAECLDKVLATPYIEDAEDKQKYKVDERPCPSCRQPISEKFSYLLRAFAPPENVKTEDDMDLDEEPPRKSKKATGKKRGRPSKGKNAAKEEPVDDDVKMEEPEDDGEIKPVGRRSARVAAKKRPSILLSDASEDEAAKSDDSMDDFIVYTDDEDDGNGRRAKKSKGKGKARAEDWDDEEGSQAEEDDEEEDRPRPFMRRLTEGEEQAIMAMQEPERFAKFLPSAKTKAMMDLLIQWRKENKNDKVMIISQWTTVLELVAAYLDQNGFDHVTFRGGMSLAQRDDAVRSFKNESNINVMLMSLKAGGVGLNLTEACKCILLDLAWSPAVENQAFDRIHRLGQHKEVEIHRLVINGTVEKRVLELQERKQNLADGSLGEGKAKKHSRFSVAELASLFGV